MDVSNSRAAGLENSRIARLLGLDEWARILHDTTLPEEAP